MYSFMDKCTPFCYFNKNVADEVMWCREGKSPTSLICISFRSKSYLCVFSCTQKIYIAYGENKRKI